MKLDDNILNYHEHMVLKHIVEMGLETAKGHDYLADLTRLALNQLSPR